MRRGYRGVAAAMLWALAESVAAQGTRFERLPDPVTDGAYRPVRLEEARLGRLLFYDPILSGGREVACATCHHPAFGTSDGLSLGLGDGGRGLGPKRVADPANPPEERVPRNAQALWNLGAHEYVAMFHDGRIEIDPARPGGLRTPIGGDMVDGFASILSAQSMFPVLSPDEMAGHYSENEVAQAVRRGVLSGPDGAWALITARVAAIPDYARAFAEVYPQRRGEIAFTDISNALAAFVEYEFRSDTSPFDAWLRGAATLPPDAMAGAELFYGSAGCAGCHAGPFQTDHLFHAMAAPQIGPGKHARFEGDHRDEGRAEVTGDPADRYAFRTPSLRNVALTAPYGHAGAQATLAGFLASHGRPGAYDRREAVLPALAAEDWLELDDDADRAAIAAASVQGPVLTDAEITALVGFLGALTDEDAAAGRLGIPEAVPSGLPVPRP